MSSDRDDARMPMSLGNLFRLFVLALLALHVFVMYSLARTWDGAFGFHLGATFGSTFFALLMLVPLLWAVTVPEWPEIYARYFRARKRWSRGRCPDCDYDLRGNPKDESNCPECGIVLVEPEPYRFTSAIFRKFIIINALAWLIGSVGGELWIRADEAAFLQEVIAKVSLGETSFQRSRDWPGIGALRWTEEQGVRSSVDQLP
jgi:hypothetical protein